MPEGFMPWVQRYEKKVKGEEFRVKIFKFRMLIYDLTIHYLRFIYYLAMELFVCGAATRKIAK